MADLGAFGEAGALLPWECRAVFADLHQRFHAEHSPEGATERALVDRLAWIEWRRRRLLLAERATHVAALAERLDDSERLLKRAGLRTRAARERCSVEAVVLGDVADAAQECAEHAADRKATERALAILERAGANAYARALAVLHEDTRAWWEDGLAGEYGHERAWTADAECLAGFLREEVDPVDTAMAAADAAQPAVRLQAFGESLDPMRMERLLAIETRLDRQFEKALAMLIQLRELRAERPRRLRAADEPSRAISRG